MSQLPDLVAYRLGATGAPERIPMFFPKSSEPEMQHIGGEPLENSGFETEDPATGFEFNERSEEGPLQ